MVADSFCRGAMDRTRPHCAPASGAVHSRLRPSVREGNLLADNICCWDLGFCRALEPFLLSALGLP